MKRLVGIIGIIIVLLLASSTPATASLGIGVGGLTFDLGEVQKGQTYYVGCMQILNVGDEPTWYKMGVSYASSQLELEVPAEWITFIPQRFYLYPGVDKVYELGYAQQIVSIYLTVPKYAHKGDYFCYLDASTDTGSWFNIAVGATLRFRVVTKIGRNNNAN